MSTDSQPTRPESARWVISKLFPAREVHLIGGPSGAGKTRFLLELIKGWSSGQPVYGFESFPKPFLYISCDRSLESVAQTMESIGVQFEVLSIPEQGPTIPGFSKTLQGLNALFSLHKDKKVFFFDAIGVFCSKPNDYNAVESFLTGLMRLCKRHDITVFGTTHATKTKEGETFLNPRQRIAGSVAWAGFSDTVVILDPVDPKSGASERDLHILPRNSADLTMRLKFTPEGKLEPVAPVDEESTEFLLDMFVKSDVELTTASLLAYAKNASISKTSVERWLRLRLEDGTLERVRRGVFRKAT